MGMLDGKVAIVTGAGHGIGRGHSMELAKHGAKVIVNDLGGSERGEGEGRDADQTVDLVKARGGEASANYGDVSDHEQCGEMVQQAIDTYGRLDIVVNNAGIVRDAAIWNMPVEDFDKVLAVHLRGTWSTSHHAATYFRAQAKAGNRINGRIINTTSGAGLTGNFGQTSYATAKAAIVGLTLTLAQELASSGVTCNCVGPSGLTRITATMPGMPDSFEPDEIGDDEFHPMDPANSSPLVAWLASDEAGYVNGQVIRSLDDRLIWMQGWREKKTISNDEKKWDATKLGARLGGEVFGLQPTGLKFEQA
ncbi:SDR family NAD(P)-dependent oxidoreductase [Rhabdothermincola salaria]|uniref:SDR family NAD(P)-dependent oxidoreductase n=1 Tax=Rhabdothermincola salaria TaxID=2903142 RepID=UPI001E4069BB|nr:SDR family NAD(P)-dependent oxidoreductase [Rhabdothermincola salaria]MCD9624085.1 SDR family oxidoreductase [Rhabdothermincola salaria]